VTEDVPRYEPWLTVPAEDYEGHMSSPDVGQLAALSDALAEACDRSCPARLLVIGCATGNGFERVDSRVTHRVVGLDINPRYLELARRRFSDSCPGLELICADVERHEFARGSFDLIFAGLVLEYVQPDRLLDGMARWMTDDGLCSVVIQLPDADHGMVSDTEFESLRALAPIMQLLTAVEVERHAGKAGMRLVAQREIPLPNGKRLQSVWLRKAE
jgi:SAM-dependent methyltransferase